MRDMVRVLVIGKTPPPYRGAPIMLEFLVRNPMQGVDVQFLRIELSTDDSQAGTFRWKKLFRLFLFIVRIIYARVMHNSQILYCAPAGFPKTTVLRDAAILCATRPFFRKTVLHFHTCGYRELYEQLPKWQRWIFRRGIFHADGVIRLSSLSPDNGQHLEARREYVVPNGIDDPFVGKPLPCATADVDECKRLRVLFVSHLCESKGVLVLIEACGKLAASGVPFQLNLMGPFENDEFAARVRSRVAELRIDDRVQFLGMLCGEDKFAVFSRSDVLCLPTYFDTFPIVLLEAMAASLPVVSTFHSGVPSIVDDGETGFLVEPRDATTLADRLGCLAENHGLRAQMGAAGREKFLREFTLARHLEHMRDVFLDVAEAPRVEGCMGAAQPLVTNDNCIGNSLDGSEHRLAS
jgi:glycosyltransferase involved in cell wall biosynthesis